MLMIAAIASILVITGAIWLAQRILPFPVCPICAGVTGTWAWLITAYFSGYQIDLAIPALLLGGTVVGTMSKLERFIKPKFVLIWKTIFVIAGFWGANNLIAGNWLLLAVGIILAFTVTLAFQTQKIGANKPDLKNCC